MRFWRALGIALSSGGGLALFACGGDEPAAAPPLVADGAAPSDPDPTAPNEPGAPPLAWLELHPLDIWAQPLPLASTRLEIEAAGKVRSEPVTERITLALARAGALTLRLSSDEHHVATFTVAFDGATLRVTTPGEAHEQAGVLVGHEVRLVEDPARVGSAASPAGAPIPVHSIYAGLRHRYFASSGRPARYGNRIELLMDGEEAWGRVKADLQTAARDIRLSTWWWTSTFELTRSGQPHATQQERQANTILGVLEASAAHKRILVGQFWGQDSILSFLNTDAALRAHAEMPNDAFEFMGQANVSEGSFQLDPAAFSFAERVQSALGSSAAQTFDPAGELRGTMPGKFVDLTAWPVSFSPQAASYHQKFVTMDDDLAYVGGMNFQGVDWDSSEHRVFDSRRMEFDADLAERQAVIDKTELPDFGPRKDYMLRVQGPSAQDVNDVFHARWLHLLEQNVTHSDRSTYFDVARDLAPLSGGTQVQVTTTLPEPFVEHSIGESWFNAVRAAEHYIFIEDQYFRMPFVDDAIVARMDENPNVHLVVLTRPVSAGTDPGCAPTARSDARFRSRYHRRYQRLQLRAFDTSIASFGIDETDAHFVDVDVHSKMLIVDDVFMSIGSANKNNRGVLYEGEMNVAVVDRTWVRAARRRIFASFLPQGTPPTDDVATFWPQLAEAAAYNDAVYARWQATDMDLDLDGAPVPADYVPRGLLYALSVVPEGACTISPVGDDLTEAPPQSRHDP